MASAHVETPHIRAVPAPAPSACPDDVRERSRDEGGVPSDDLEPTSSLSTQTHDLLTEAQTCPPERRRAIMDEVVTSHLWLARSIARRFDRRGEDFDDLYQVACCGLVEAAHRFDPAHASFVAFAAPTIAGVVKRHFRNHSWAVRPPRRVQELAVSLWQIWPDVSQEVGGQPTSEQLAHRLGVDVESVRAARTASGAHTGVSMDSSPLGDRMAAEVDLLTGIENSLLIRQLMRGLSSEDRRLLQLRFVEELSQSEIAAELGVSQMQVSRKLSRLLGRLASTCAEAELPMAG